LCVLGSNTYFGLFLSYLTYNKVGCGQGGDTSPSAGARATLNPAVGGTSICMLGASITAKGREWRSRMAGLRPEWNYMGSLSDGTYLHDGVGGDTTVDALARLGAVPVCDITLVDLGGNDLKNGLPSAQIVANVVTIADYLAARGSKVYIINVMPCHDCGVNWNLKILLLNNRFAGITGYPVLSAHAAIMAAPYPASWMYVDAVHLSTLGYYVLADALAPQVTP